MCISKGRLDYTMDRFLLHKVHLKKKKTNFLKDKCIERMQNIRNKEKKNS